MGATILDCRGVASGFRDWVAGALRELEFSPCLAAVLLRPQDNPASRRYRDLILKDAETWGVTARSIEVDREEALFQTIPGLRGLIQARARLRAAPARSLSSTCADSLSSLKTTKASSDAVSRECGSNSSGK